MMGIFRFGHKAQMTPELARAKNGGAAEPASKARTVGRVGAADPRMISSRLGRERGSNVRLATTSTCRRRAGRLVTVRELPRVALARRGATMSRAGGNTLSRSTSGTMPARGQRRKTGQRQQQAEQYLGVMDVVLA